MALGKSVLVASAVMTAGVDSGFCFVQFMQKEGRLFNRGKRRPSYGVDDGRV